MTNEVAIKKSISASIASSNLDEQGKEYSNQIDHRLISALRYTAKMTDAQETPDPTAAAVAAKAASAAENDDEGDMDSEADEARSKLENIKYYASLFLGTVSH